MLRMAPRLNRGPLARLRTAVKSSLAPWQVRSSLLRGKAHTLVGMSLDLGTPDSLLLRRPLAPLAATVRSLALNSIAKSQTQVTNLLSTPLSPKAAESLPPTPTTL